MNEPKYIDAEAFKRRILSYGTVTEKDRIPIPFYKHYFAKAYVAMLRWVCEEVDDTPCAEVAQTQAGRWEDVAHATNSLLYATCSVCGRRQTIETTNYCGNCGARMVEERMIRTINARDAVEFLRENELTITRCKSCYQHKDIDDRCYCHKLEMYVDGDWFCKDAKAKGCDTCEVAKYHNLEDDDSICRDCEAEE